MEFVILIISAIITGIIAEAIASSKNQKGFWWGFWLSWIGIIVVACMPNNTNTNNNSYNNSSKYEKLEKLQKLKETNAITEEEFKTEKSKLLNS